MNKIQFGLNKGIVGRFIRQLRGRPFRRKGLEQQFWAEYRAAGLRLGYAYCWIASLSFLVFSVFEYFSLDREMDHPIQIARALAILAFFLIGLHVKVYNHMYERTYELAIFVLVLVYASVVMVFEFYTQLKGHPEFFYLSVTATCILLSIASYYLSRLPLWVSGVLSATLAALTYFAVWRSGVFEPLVAGRMMTYIAVGNVAGLFIRIMFDLRERKLFLQNLRLQNIAALRLRVLQAESAAQAKTKLLAMLSHEIRTPMNTVVRLMGLVKRDFEGQLTEKRAQTFCQVEAACEQLIATLDDLLRYAVDHSSSFNPSSCRAFSLAELLRECQDTLALSAEEKGLQMSVQTDEVEGIVFVGHPHPLKRVLLNLLVNAIKFTDEGRVTISALCQRVTAGRADVILSVADTGVGIARAEIGKIFEPFYQVDSSYARRFSGSGLGLAISRQLVEAMGGRIKVSSEPGRGATFAVHIALKTSGA